MNQRFQLNDWNYYDDGTRTDWLQDSELSVLPEPIAHEYKRIKSLIANGEPYGALVQLKDTLEITIKFCVLAESARINRKDIKSNDEVAILKMLTEKPLLLSHWKIMLEQINNLDDLSLHMKLVAHHVLQLYTGKADVVAWRNERIGHGALGYDDSPDMKKEFLIILEALTSCLRQCLCGFTSMKLECRNERTDEDSEISSVYLVIEGQSIDLCLFPFMIYHEQNIYFFDGFVSGKGECDLLCYPLGKKISSKKNGDLQILSKEITLLHQKYQHESNKRNLINELVKDTSCLNEDIYLRQAEEYLIEAIKIKDSVRTDYLQKWVNEKIKSEKGIYLFQAYSEAGKTIAALQMEGRINNKISFHAVTVKVIYINDVNCKTGRILDSIQNVMSCGNKGELLFRGGSKPILMEVEDIESRKKILADYLNQMKKLLEQLKQCESKLLLVIDGIDEVIQSELDFFDYIPEAGALDTGLYILLTSRLDEELPSEKRIKLHQLNFDDILVKNHQNDEIIRMQKDYIKKQMPELSDDHFSKIIETGEDSFLQIHLAIFMLKNRMATLDILGNVNQNSMTDCFLKYLVQMYSGRSRELLLCVLYLLARDGESRSLDMVAYQIGEKGIPFLLVGILNDLKVLLTVKHYHVNLFSVNHGRTGDVIIGFMEQQGNREYTEQRLIQCWKERIEDIAYWDEETLYQHKDQKEYDKALDQMMEISPQDFYFLSMFFTHPLSKKMELWNDLFTHHVWCFTFQKLYAGPNGYLRTKEWAVNNRILAVNIADFIECQIKYQKTILRDDSNAMRIPWFICKAFSDWRFWLTDLKRENHLNEFLEEKSEMNQCYGILLHFYEEGVKTVNQEQRGHLGQGYYNFFVLIEEGILRLLQQLVEFYSELQKNSISQKYSAKICEIQKKSVKRWDPKMNEYSDKELLYHLYFNARMHEWQGEGDQSDYCLQMAHKLKENLKTYLEDEFRQLDVEKEEVWVELVREIPKEETMTAKVKSEVLLLTQKLVILLEKEVKILRKEEDEGSRDDRLSEDLRQIAGDFNYCAMRSMMGDRQKALQLSSAANHLYELMTLRMQDYYLLQHVDVVAVYGLLTKSMGDMVHHEEVVHWYLLRRDVIKGLIKKRVGRVCEEAEHNTWLLDGMAAPYENKSEEEVKQNIFHEAFFELHEEKTDKIFVRCKGDHYSQARESKENEKRIWVKFKKKYCNFCEYYDCPAFKGIHEVIIDREAMSRI